MCGGGGDSLYSGRGGERDGVEGGILHSFTNVGVSGNKLIETISQIYQLIVRRFIINYDELKTSYNRSICKYIQRYDPRPVYT